MEGKSLLYVKLPVKRDLGDDVRGMNLLIAVR
jgi:hypothetical protein